MIQKTIRRTLLAVYLLLVMVSTLAPLSGDMYRPFAGFDKLVHFGLFAGVAYLLYWNLNSVRRPNPWISVSFATGLAGAIELVQSVLTYRSGDLWDFVAGGLGAVAGATLALGAASLGHRIPG